MTIALDTEIVATRFDPLTQTNYYTVERNGHRWTVAIHNDHFHHVAKGAAHPREASTKRRDHLARKINEAMLGQPDA